MNQTRQTRRERNVQVDRFRLFKPYIFYVVVLGIMHYGAVRSASLSLSTSLGLVFVGLLTWQFFEYAVHRWVLHREPKANGFNFPGTLTHLRHHENPNSLVRLSVQLGESVPIGIGYCLIAWLVTGSWQAMTYVFSGLIAGYFFYEYLDFQAHYGTAGGRFVRYFRKYHLQHHHFDATVRYGVTTPIFDYLFGTFHLEQKRQPVRVARTTVQSGGAAASARSQAY